MNILVVLILLSTAVSPASAFDTAARREFSTDFSRALVGPEEIRSGGPPKEGIPALENPEFTTPKEADAWIGAREPVLLLRRHGSVKIYPLQILMWHEIVNDTIGGEAVAVTFCPLCNTGIAFSRRIDGRLLDFGTTGRLRNSNLIMYDRQTESWWQQADGKAIAGEYTGSVLGQLPVQRSSWQDAREAFPEAQVLSRNTGFTRAYGRNPYRGYDTGGRSPFLYDGPAPPERDPVARVLQLSHAGESAVFSYEELSERRILHTELAGENFVIFYEAETASALDSSAISEGRAVGSANAYHTLLGDRRLEFRVRFGRITDLQTGSRWSSLGEAIAGPLKGERLKPAVAADHFWFSAWSFFFRD
jgi:hypothetical protein